MRVKTEERRQGIIDKAGEVFREMGFDRASMSDIAARVGGSKATLYSYFPSKEELFVAVMKQSTEVGSVYNVFVDPLAGPKVSSFEELRQVLETFGLGYLKLQSSDNALSVRRSLISHGDRSDLAKTAFESGPLLHLMNLATFLQRMMQEGYLRQEVPWVAMGHLTHLLESGIILPRLLGLIKAIPPAMIEQMVPRSVDVFLRGYGTPEHIAKLNKKAA